ENAGNKGDGVRRKRVRRADILKAPVVRELTVPKLNVARRVIHLGRPCVWFDIYPGARTMCPIFAGKAGLVKVAVGKRSMSQLYDRHALAPIIGKPTFPCTDVFADDLVVIANV